jgi:cell division transport system ATP-binding protein
VIRFEGVAKRHPNGIVPLSGLSTFIDRGEMVFVCGHSGAGKSTLLKLIALVERISEGRLSVGGTDLGTLPKSKVPWHRRRIGLVYQDHRLLMDRSVFDNVALPLVVQGVPHAELVRRVRQALDRVGLLHKERQPPLALSGGEQQRVGIARAIVGRPEVILADEPTGNLDPDLAAEIMQLFCDLGAGGSTVVVASHDLPLVKRLRKRVLVLDHGHLIEDFRPEALHG